MKISVIFLLLMIAIAGCTDKDLGVADPTTAATPVPAIISSHATTIPTSNPPTPRPTTIVTTKTIAPQASGKPLAAPVTLTGVGNQIVRFSTVAPGTVALKIKYPYSACTYVGCSKPVENCEEKQLVFALAGKSIDTNLVYKPIASSVDTTKTFNLLSPGGYSISVKSCNQWQIVVSNA